MSDRSHPLEARVRATLTAKADQVEVRPRRFDPHRPPLRLVAGLAAPPGRAPSRRRHRLGLVATVAVVAAVAAAVVVVLGPGPDDEPSPPSDRSEATTGPVAPVDEPLPDGVLAPTVVPDDLTLWSVGWRATPAGVPSTIGVEQLFGPAAGGSGAAGPKVHVWVQPGARGGDGDVLGEPATVRGRPGGVFPAKEFPDDHSTLTWSEAGASISASFASADRSAAVALLDDLVWRSTDPAEGFAPPAPGGDVALVAETVGAGPPPPPAPDVWEAELTYLDDARNLGPGVGRQLVVRTTTASGHTGTSASYLRTWFHGEPGPGGLIQSYDPRYGALRRDWPDGRSLWIDANATAIDEATLVEVADAVEPATSAGLADLVGGVRSRIAGQELVAAADLPDGRLEVRGTGPTTALCLVPPGGDRLCPAGGTAAAELLGQGFLVGDRWYVLAASKQGELQVTEPGMASGPGTVPPALPGVVTAASGEWHLAVVVVPDGWDEVGVWRAVDGMGGTNLLRRDAER